MVELAGVELARSMGMAWKMEGAPPESGPPRQNCTAMVRVMGMNGSEINETFCERIVVVFPVAPQICTTSAPLYPCVPVMGLTVSSTLEAQLYSGAAWANAGMEQSEMVHTARSKLRCFIENLPLVNFD